MYSFLHLCVEKIFFVFLNELADCLHLKSRISLVFQWLRICLPMQGTQVQSLVQEAPHAVGQLSPCSTATELKLWSLCPAVRSHYGKKSAPQLESGPSLQPEKAHATQ